MAKQTVDESLPLDVLVFARPGYLSRKARGRCSWKRAGKAAGTIFFHAHDDAVDLIYDLGGRDGTEVVHRAYPIQVERTPAPFGGEQVWFRCPACHVRARKLYLPPGRTYFLCRTCHDLSYASRQKRASALSKALERIETLTTTLADTKVDSRRWRRVYIETQEVVKVFGETDFLADLRRPLGRSRPDEHRLELAQVPRGRGRPKEKRPYVRLVPFARGAKNSGQESLCLRCRDFREMQDPQPVTLPNGRPALKGSCPVCGAGMCHIITQETAARDRRR